ncbi:hypothetical protein CMI47_10380 [Candidatus Pacearchaeota archaeon]|nr:hypothetical protein [Candidatus Pacearchaeota archaeon]
MSIKKLFDKDIKSRNYLADTTEKEAFEEVESADNVREIYEKQQTFVPPVDYSKPENFVKYGSAYLYYKSAIERIIDFYPYDGSDAEMNEFYNNSLDIEKYIFNNLYPRTHGHIKLSSAGWGSRSGSLLDGYGLPEDLEYIDFKGGPNTISATKTAKLFKDPHSSNPEFANIYDTDIYVSAGLPAGYGTGSRESNLKADFDKGVTIECWAKTGSITLADTNKQILVDIWNNELSCSAYDPEGTAGANPNPHYGRVTIAFDGTAGTAATATIIGNASLDDATGTSLILVNADASTVTFTTDPTLNFGDVTADTGDTASTATIVGTAALAAESGTDFKLVNADGTVITFTTNATKNFGDTVDETASPFTVNTGGSFSSDGIRKATQALWISCKAAIDAGELDMTISPTTVDTIADGSQVNFTLTQTTGGTAGNTAITLITGVTADGETAFTGGVDQQWRVNTRDISGGSEVRKATQAFWIACKGAIDAGELDMTINPTTVAPIASGQEYFTLTQTTAGTAGNTAITLITGVTADGETNFTGGTRATPFRISAQSGAVGISEQVIGNNIGVDTFDDWKHYAFVMHNTGSNFITKLYVNGRINDINTVVGTTINEINSKNMVGRLGALLTAPSGSAATSQQTQTLSLGAGKFNGSIDEFRYWKEARSGKDIGKYWFTQVRGGTNTDLANTTLGVYYKFNEGITGTSTTDLTVLDFSGRLSNGTWKNYVATGRSTGSAILEATASISEYKDPIIYAHDPNVTSLKNNLLESGSYHDSTHNSFIDLVPNWIIDDIEVRQITDLKVIAHIMGAYFDKIHMWISQIPTFKNNLYTSASYEPPPFSQHLPQSLGLYTPQIFVNSHVLERFLNRDKDSKFEGDLNETKNLIYLNLYNNLTNIFKAKGTQKAIRNVFRCFNIDERIIKLNTYANNSVYTLTNNLQQTLVRKSSLNFNTGSNTPGVVYQALSSSNPQSQGYISGSNKVGYETKYGFTVEADVVFPRYLFNQGTVDRNVTEVSLFGAYTVDTGSAGSKTGTDTTWGAYSSDLAAAFPGQITGKGQPDLANFQVYAVRDVRGSKNVRFKLSSSNYPYYIPELTSSTFFSVYDHTHWNFSVRIKPSNYPLLGVVSGSDAGSAGSGLDGYAYDLVFQGINNELGVTRDSFVVTASLTKDVGTSILCSSKRLYAGARKINITGATLNHCDALISSVRYWSKYIDDNSLELHNNDINNRGVSGSYQNFGFLDPNISGSNDVSNLKSLVLDWNFNQVTGSDAEGGFYVTDFSSGSSTIRDNYSWVGKLAGYQYFGSGSGFWPGSTDIVHQEAVNSYKFVDPEKVISSDMVQVLTEDDKLFGLPDTIPSYKYTLEKSQYAAISEEMLQFFAGVADFHNLIGAPVNRYRERYKDLEKLRELFFRRVTEVKQVEKFLDYYRWFDDSLSQIIAQLLPASTDFVENSYNTIESHVLERNKYKSQFPTLKLEDDELQAAMEGQYANSYPYVAGSTPLPESPRSTKKNRWFWEKRANRSAAEITSGDATVDEQRNTIKNVIYENPHLSQSMTRAWTGTKFYDGRWLAVNRLAKTVALKVTTPFESASLSLKGGVNFTDNKNIQFTYNALYPAGPVNGTNNVYVPENVMVGFTDDMERYHETIDLEDVNMKFKRRLKINHGRNWEDGLGYSNVKSSYAFPFNIITPAVSSGYNKQVIDRVTASVQITNLHHDGYGPNMEVPMQGPFTNYAVGGHQSRHVPLNTGSDNYTNRPEAWKLLLGQCNGVSVTSGAIGMAGPDYPWPEANEEGVRPYPMTASQKAVYYRGFIAKRPVNIRNILLKTGSTILGNYSKNYEIIQSVGAFSNPRNFIENQPVLPAQIIKATQGRTFLGTRRESGSHFQFTSEYSTGYLTGATGDSIITARFSAPGGMEVMSKGYLDIRGSEYSPYNSLLNRNLSVIKPTQGPSGTFSVPIGTGTAGMRVNDIHGKDFGLRALLSRHSARFGRDSLFVTTSNNLPGASYEQLPSFQKIHRNTQRRIRITNDGTLSDIGTVTVESSSQFDNYFVQYAIPRSDRQYSWFTSSLLDSNSTRYFGYAPLQPPDVAGYYYNPNTERYVSFFDFITGSDVTSSTLPTMYQPTNPLNIFVVDAVSGGVNNILGFPTAALDTNANKYFNKSFLAVVPTAVSSAVTDNQANYFNLLMAKRGNAYGWNWKSTHQSYNSILTAERNTNQISIADENNAITQYALKPVSLRGRPTYINFSASPSVTIKATNNNEKIYFSDVDLSDYVYGSSVDTTTTPYDQIVSLMKDDLNWIAYTEEMIPSARNEFESYSMERTGYDNKYWRATNVERVALGATVPNSFGFIDDLSQSSWPLDAPVDFLTRTGPPTGTLPALVIFPTSGSAGELQNTYFSYFTGTLADGALPVEYNAPRMLRFGGLYNRKHMVSTRRSPVSPTGPDPIGTVPPASDFVGTIDPYSGEAIWEPGGQAGILIKDGSALTFESHPSEPWFKNYDSFKEDVKLVAKGYSIIPEFRISTHVEDYMRNGIDDPAKTNTFEIPGTTITSADSSFYRDYSNSEFMKDFLKVKSDSLLNATEIKLICSAAIRLNPYKGFYPSQRTLNLISQFSKSYGNGLIGSALRNAAVMTEYGFPKLLQPAAAAGALRPLFQTLFAPGILYNSIKSGMAVDYPILLDDSKIERKTDFYGTSAPDTEFNPTTDNWALTPARSGSNDVTLGLGYQGGEFWDKRISFENIMTPEKELAGLSLLDCETHPSMSLQVTASWDGQASDKLYTLMAKNFFGEVGNFFLKDQSFTKLESNVLTDGMTFDSGSWFGARLKLRRSTTGGRSYQYESGSDGTGRPYGKFGGLGVRGQANQSQYPLRVHFVSGAEFPLPQDPRQNIFFKESFTMYSRPTAFGPPVGGRPTGSFATLAEHNGSAEMGTVACAPVDSFSGFNWAFTPPYYNGEAWVDLIFKPGRQGTRSYDLDRILSEIETVYWRVDPGYNGMGIFPWADGETPLLRSFVDFSASLQPIYSGRNVNANAMQISASINIFGVEDVDEQEMDAFGNQIKSTNKVAGKKWVIQPKFETPMMNFSDNSIRPISVAAGTLTRPEKYGSAAVPRGMWHQFGILPSEPNEGIFLEIGDIPTNWLQHHYDVTNADNSIYNDSDATGAGQKVYKRMKSLTDLVGFSDTGVSARLGELRENVILREAIVAVPYIIESVENKTLRRGVGKYFSQTRKKFIDIPLDRYNAALDEEKGSLTGDSLDAAGASIRKLVQKMERYILPPQFDFLNNEAVDPIVMYMFEFEYKLDKNDLAYIWQNLAPRNYKKLTLKTESICHDLSINELLEEDDIMENKNLRWMVFKVKQKSQISYDDLVQSQARASSKGTFNFNEKRSRERSSLTSREKESSTRSTRSPSRSRAVTTSATGYEIGYNWPYDYISFVEMIKMDVQLLYEKVDEETGLRRRSTKDSAGREDVSATAAGMKVSSGLSSDAGSSGLSSDAGSSGLKRTKKLLGGD